MDVIKRGFCPQGPMGRGHSATGTLTVARQLPWHNREAPEPDQKTGHVSWPLKGREAAGNREISTVGTLGPGSEHNRHKYQ